jgi:hypothetical protein
MCGHFIFMLITAVSCFAFFKPPPVPTATSDMPATDEYPGPHSFEIEVNSRSAGRNLMVSITYKIVQ